MTQLAQHILGQARWHSFIVFYTGYVVKTLVLLLILYIPFYVTPILYIIGRKQSGQASDMQKKQEKRYFWRNVFLMPIISLAGIIILYKIQYFTIFPDTTWYMTIAECLVIILLHDAYFYWSHRLLHTKYFYKRFHIIHHLCVHPTLYSSAQFDLVELVINYSYLLRYMLLVGWIFGGIHYIPVFVFLMFTTFWNYYGHSGVELYGPGFAKHRLGKWFMTSTYHDVHHSKNNGNYAFFFTFWDRLCGTVSKDYDESYKHITSKK